MITTKRQRKLISAAFRKFQQIKPIGAAKSLCDPRCFTLGYGRILGGKLLFWFETKDGSSHIIAEGIDDENKSNIPN